MIFIYTILINDSNELVTSVKERIMEKSKLVDSFHFLLNPIYKGMDMSGFTVVMEYRLPQSLIYKTELLTLSDELYKEHLEYILPFDTAITKEAGDVSVKLTFTKVDMNADGEVIQYVRHTSSTSITITPIETWSDMIPDESLTSLAQALLKVDSQIQMLKDTTAILSDTQPDNLTYEDGYLQLSSHGEGIGDKVQISETDGTIPSQTIKVIEF